MKTEYERKLELVLIVIMACAVFLFACYVVEGDRCKSLWLDCPTRTNSMEICDNCYLLSQHVEGNTRYFKFYDCVDKETLQSSVSASCTLEGR